MPGTIDTIDVHLFYGTVASLKQTVDVYRVFGQSGYGVFKGGTGDGEFQLRTVYYAADSVDSSNHIAACEALQGQIVTIFDQFGQSFTDCLIQRVNTQPNFDAQQAVDFEGNPDAVRTEIGWQCVRVA